MVQGSERIPFKLACCVCGKPVYREDNPLIGDPDCPIRHRDCVKPKPPRA